VEVERLFRNWEIELDWAPFFLDPSIPPEGRPRQPQAPGSPETPLETRGTRLGLEFRRGRTFTPHTLLALQAGEFARQHGSVQQVLDYHRALFKAYFTDFDNLMDPDVLVRHAEAVGLDGAALRVALADGTHVDEVNEGIEHAYAVGVQAIPTFILDERYAVVGAQEYETLERVMEQLQARRRETPLPDPRA
jgi:predicted DsbA family dithiol-disulfide isomerase